MASIKDWINLIANLPQTQMDIRMIASATEQAQSPEFKQQFEQAATGIETYTKIQLGLQALATAALVGVFILGLSQHSKNGGKK